MLSETLFLYWSLSSCQIHNSCYQFCMRASRELVDQQPSPAQEGLWAEHSELDMGSPGIAFVRNTKESAVERTLH